MIEWDVPHEVCTIRPGTEKADFKVHVYLPHFSEKESEAQRSDWEIPRPPSSPARMPIYDHVTPHEFGNHQGGCYHTVGPVLGSAAKAHTRDDPCVQEIPNPEKETDMWPGNFSNAYQRPWQKGRQVQELFVCRVRHLTQLRSWGRWHSKGSWKPLKLFPLLHTAYFIRWQTAFQSDCRCTCEGQSLQ